MKSIFQSRTQELSPREKEILHCISEGLSSKQIADRLFVSKYTVDTHRRNMIRKQNARNCTELIRSIVV